ncbi:hypothetical protein COCSUDRAFT_58497 [Coccomyxa subellipsoidea C-169]|uniref:Uncharacterized protein n=1 Tax=Coccomyxa subellipsoidea (strain C-169) TaxID=574566 RepID=I0YN00_COCSC|nr:hypothetical protein COCSUDRAFT_58497 [Coccomyxa subellipsoidea C-169]EIE19769.1 hypothetical protein COCSUDRAFT_58497 [Coccomyxa subellipsoidea C-169]|eukprot:XP_005644313.1 hypothetical protein COCSUDRAFT_58497 [Coccomyxa subellipsoidea C-169]
MDLSAPQSDPGPYFAVFARHFPSPAGASALDAAAAAQRSGKQPKMSPADGAEGSSQNPTSFSPPGARILYAATILQVSYFSICGAAAIGRHVARMHA